MTEYDNNLTGVLYKNDNKKTEKQPDYKGECEVDGVKYWIAGWAKISKAGNRVMSLKFTDKNDTSKKAMAASKSTKPVEGFSDDIPFSGVGRVTPNALDPNDSHGRLEHLLDD
jgi:hypothetical protein